MSKIDNAWSSYSPELFGKVAVLMGGQSAEREVSLQSGNAIYQGLCQQGVNAVLVDVGDDLPTCLQQGQFDRAFIALHGRGGEDGRVQALLEFMHIPYTGSGVSASALGMDKLLSKKLWQMEGLPTPEYRILDSNQEQVLNELGLPLMVKPADEGSSLGISRVDEVEQLQPAWEAAIKYQSPVFAEQCIDGYEYTVAILQDKALPVIRLETDRQFYDYEAKYLRNDTRYICPCGLSAEKEKDCQKIALQAFSVLGCSGWGRVDFFLDKQQNLFLIEVNTVPGMTDHSLVPMAARYAGMNFDELLLQILASSLYAG